MIATCASVIPRYPAGKPYDRRLTKVIFFANVYEIEFEVIGVLSVSVFRENVLGNLCDSEALKARISCAAFTSAIYT